MTEAQGSRRFQRGRAATKRTTDHTDVHGFLTTRHAKGEWEDDSGRPEDLRVARGNTEIVVQRGRAATKIYSPRSARRRVGHGGLAGVAVRRRTCCSDDEQKPSYGARILACGESPVSSGEATPGKPGAMYFGYGDPRWARYGGLALIAES